MRIVNFKGILSATLVALMFSWPMAQAEEKEAAASTAYDVVQKATERVMEVVREAPEYIDDNPDLYYSQLLTILDEVVDFPGFAKGVMGSYATRSYYQSLSPEGKAQLRQYVKDFTSEVRVGLVRTYGKGLLAFGGSRVEIKRPDTPEEPGTNRAEVTQLIYSDAPEPYVIEYQMRRGKKGKWRLRNLIVETVNLGVIYRNQFQAAARDAEGDLNTVIDNWTAPKDQPELE